MNEKKSCVASNRKNNKSYVKKKLLHQLDKGIYVSAVRDNLKATAIERK